MANCTCPIWLGQGCSHVGALLYGIAHLKKLGAKVIPDDPVKTSLPQTWHQPRGEKVGGKEVQKVVGHGYNKRRGPMKVPKRSLHSTLYNPLRSDMPNLEELHTALEQVAPEAMILPTLKNSSITPKVPTRFGQFHKGSVVAVHQKMDSQCLISVYDGSEYPSLPVSNKMLSNVPMPSFTHKKHLKVESLTCLKCSEQQVHRYEELTRLQSQSNLWHTLKLGPSSLLILMTHAFLSCLFFWETVKPKSFVHVLILVSAICCTPRDTTVFNWGGGCTPLCWSAFQNTVHWHLTWLGQVISSSVTK